MNFEKLWNLPQKNPGRILSFRTNPRLKESLKHPTLFFRQKSVQCPYQFRTLNHSCIKDAEMVLEHF